jgi:hypothetical protein
MKKKIQGYIWDLERFGLTPSKILRRLSGSSRAIICNSIPKAGTHLLERSLCLHPSIYRKFIPTINGNNIEKHGGIQSLTSNAKKGQLLISHLEYDEVIEKSIVSRDLASFFMIRDPRDVVVSLSHYGLSSKKHRLHTLFSKLSSQERLLMSIQGNKELNLPSIGERLDAYSGWLNSSAKVIRFEDIIGGMGSGDENTQRIVLSDVYKHCQVELSDLDAIISKVYSSKSPTFRKGVIGGWKGVFDSETKDAFKKVAGKALIAYGYESDENW